MKIAVVAPTALPSRRANTVQVMKMTQALAGLGHEVRLAAPAVARTVSPGSSDHVARTVSPGYAADWDQLSHHYGLHTRFPVEWLPAWPPLRRYDYGWRAVRWARSWGAELLYTRLPQAAALASLGGFPTILEMHDLPYGAGGPLLFRLFLRGRGARRLVVITRSLAGDLARRFKFQTGLPFTLVAPDGVDLERYEDLPSPQEARLALPLLRGRGFTAGYTGHLYRGRGVALILSLAGRLPQVTFLLAGGELQEVERLRGEVERLSLGNVLLAGFIPNADLPRFQAACDVLLMPYGRRVAASSGGDIGRYLSPMKLFEYLACGRPVVSSDLPVLREVLTPDISILLPPDDIPAWAAALEALCHDLARRDALGAAARRAAAGYTWKARAERILDGLAPGRS